ncbi:PfkB family carbohydrate kinase [Streptomyces viridochromogenes]|uniref:PfkB family carbohydrate kinase n=1 Tax=Streptomyces viridochromogenes TaxID=1938 RepID=UPI001FCB72A6|nr:PfkB family carbohydrate kinase [Streptomyces viridochromogenes]
MAELLAPAPLVVVKDAEHGATSYTAGGVTFVPALTVEVVEPVGAGEAFAAGYLSGGLRDLDSAAMTAPRPPDGGGRPAQPGRHA